MVSNAAPFVVNPPMTALGPLLPTGIVGTAYSTPLITGGTGPFNTTLLDTPLPPGLTISTDGTRLVGTPSTAGGYNFSLSFLDAWGNTLTVNDSMQVVVSLTPVISSLTPPSGLAGGAAFTLTVGGSNFISGAQVMFGTSPLATTFVNGSTLTAAVPASLIARSGPTSVTVVNPGGVQSAPASFTAYSQLQLLTTTLPAGQTGVAYSFTLQATGGVPPYTFSVTGLPTGITVNAATGVISGTWTTAATYSGTIKVTDNSGQTASSTYSTSITSPAAPLQISTASIPAATVGTAYGVSFFASGGTPPYNFTFAGTPPPGLAFAGGAVGGLSGTPTTAGTYTFTATVTDNNNGTASKQFTLTVAPGPLTITTASLPNGQVGTAYSAQTAATGGAPPYAWTFTGLPPGLSASSAGAISGTPTTAGPYSVAATVIDFAGTRATKTYAVTIAGPSLTVTTTSLPAGVVGTAYSASLSASGGVQPYTWTATGLPAGLSVSAAGSITGAPTTAGNFTVGVTVKDANGTTASASLALAVSAAPLTITTTSLPAGTVGTAYSASLTAAGGVQPYTWIVTGLPAGLSSSADGSITGTPTTAGNFTVAVTVTDAKGTSALASLTLAVKTSPLTITTTSLPAGVVGTAYSASLTAAGGVAPYTFTVSGLPGGVTASAAGAISGTPTAPGSFTVAATVTDSVGTTASASLPLTVGLPPTPPLTFSGLPASGNSSSQPTLTVALGSAYPLPVTVALTLTFAPGSGPDDPAVQFSTGGRTAVITVPAGQTAGATSVGVQTGTVAGTITIAAQMTAAGQNVTPSPAPNTTIKIGASAPVITSVTAAASSGGFTVTIVGFSNTRDLTQGTFTFTAASGVNLQTGNVTVPLTAAFTTWYQSAASAPFGSQFTLTQPFTVSGNQQAVASLSVTLTNSVGTSAALTTNNVP